MRFALLIALCSFVPAFAADDFGTLVFSDDFERSESQELKDEPGNG
ncbi:MAG TPA: hypothetical protein VHX44_18020 [Planctomycetota bacterium]|nr:hypothetical protein [Planctomycetota bacterium]